MRIGTDIVEIDRIAKACSKEHFLQRVFTPLEIDYAKSRGKQEFASLAGMYAAKEAYVKALGIGFRKGTWQDMEVRRDEWGAPYLVRTGYFKEYELSLGISEVSLSISHAKAYATSTVIMG